MSIIDYGSIDIKDKYGTPKTIVRGSKTDSISHEHFCFRQADDGIDRFYSCDESRNQFFISKSVRPGMHNFLYFATNFYDRNSYRGGQYGSLVYATKRYRPFDLMPGEIYFLGNLILKDLIGGEEVENVDPKVFDHDFPAGTPFGFDVEFIDHSEKAALTYIEARFPNYRGKINILKLQD